MVELEASVIVLDLDDTLYLERDYASSGFASVGRHLEPKINGGEFARLCRKLLESGTRGDIFDKALRTMGQKAPPELIEELVAIYRSHKPDISLCQDAARYLDRLGGAFTALISDGPVEVQRAKVDALGIGRRFDRTILTGAWPDGFGKPHPRAFLEVIAWSGARAGQVVYIADNAQKDFLTPRLLGWQTIQILRPGRIHDGRAPTALHAAQHHIESLDSITLVESELRTGTGS